MRARLIPAQCTTEDGLIAAARKADALIHEYYPITRREIEALDRCRVISHHGIGLDKIDVAAATEKGICVANVIDASLDETSDHPLGMVSACGRRFMDFERAVRGGAGTTRCAADIISFAGFTLSCGALRKLLRVNMEWSSHRWRRS